MSDFTLIKQLFAIGEGLGCSEKEIQAAVDKYQALPQVLCDFYRQLGREGFNQVQDSLCLPEDLFTVGEDYLCFYTENQGVVYWCIKLSDLQADNPPVYCTYDSQEFLLETDHLEDFLIAISFLQSVFALPFSSEAFYWLTAEELQLLKQHFQTKNYSISQWLDVAFLGNHDDEILVLYAIDEEDGIQLAYASSSQEHFEAINQFVNEHNFEVL